MEKSSFLRRDSNLASILLLAFLSSGCSFNYGSSNFFKDRPNPFLFEEVIEEGRGVKEYLYSNNEGIKRQFEEYFGVRVPDYNLVFLDKLDDGAPMTYFYDNGGNHTISVSTLESQPFQTRSIEEECWEKKVLIKASQGISLKGRDKNYGTIKGDFIHELGHVYVKHEIEELRSRGLLDPSYDRNMRDKIDRVIFEGISEYLAVKSGENLPKKVSPGFNFEGDFASWDKVSYYELGRRIVTPIFDNMGLERGVELIYQRPKISFEELRKPERYWGRVFN